MKKNDYLKFRFPGEYDPYYDIEPEVYKNPELLEFREYVKDHTDKIGIMYLQAIQEKDTEALSIIITNINRLIMRTYMMVRNQPELANKVSKKFSTWPAVISNLPAFRPSRKKGGIHRNKELLDVLDLDSEVGISVTPQTKWQIEDVPIQYSIAILSHINYNRSLKNENLLKKPYPEWVEQAINLPEWSKKTSDQWFYVGRDAIEEINPEFQDRMEWVPLLSNLTKRWERRNERDRLIKRALKSLAPKLG